MQCRPECGACCISPSINTPFYGMPEGKAASIVCVHLDEQRRCRLFGDPRRPAACGDFQASVEVCGSSPEQAITILDQLEMDSLPDGRSVP
ncbi:MAG: YkgJ family cysteine cluster protein [Halieaceae bacterium]|nr:YkgJ family cysteine cluster protein [Halieaceae bacterium]